MVPDGISGSDAVYLPAVETALSIVHDASSLVIRPRNHICRNHFRFCPDSQNLPKVIRGRGAQNGYGLRTSFINFFRSIQLNQKFVHRTFPSNNYAMFPTISRQLI